MKVKTPEYVEISSDSDLYIKRDIDGTSLVVGVHDFEIPDPLTLHNGLISEDNPSRFFAGLYATEITLGETENGHLTSSTRSTELRHQDGYRIEVRYACINLKDANSTTLLSVGADADSAYLDVNCPIRPNSYFTSIKTPDISGKENSGKIEFTISGGQYGKIEFFLYNSNNDSYVSEGYFGANGFVTDKIHSSSIETSTIGDSSNRVSDIYVNTIHALTYDGLPSGQVSTVDRLMVNGSTKLQAESDKVQVYTDLVPGQHLSLGTSLDSWSDIYVEKIKFKAQNGYLDLYADPEVDYDLILEGNFLPGSSSGSSFSSFSIGTSTSYWSNGYIHELYSNKLTLSEGSSLVELYSDQGRLTSSRSIVPDVRQGTLLDLGAVGRSWGTLYIQALSDAARLAIVNMLLDDNGIGCLKMIMIPSNVVKYRGDEIDAPYIWDFSMGWMSDDLGYNIKRDTSGWNQHSLNGTWKALNSYGGGALSYYVVLAVRIA